MKRNYKPRAVRLSEGDDGLFTLHCSTKEIAHKAMTLAVKEDFEAEPPVIKIDEIKEERMYRCPDCKFYNLEDNLCCECGAQLTSRARKTFVYYFNQII